MAPETPTHGKPPDISKWQLTTLFFAFGAILILLGVTKILNVAGISATMADQSRWLAIIVGCLCLPIAVVLHYVPVRKFTETGLRLDYLLSGNQLAILNLFQEAPLKRFPQADATTLIKNRVSDLKDRQDSEIFFRLETLYLLGYLGKEELNKNYYYYLSPTYRKKLELET